jgi:preprotein translocase subunit YajC
MASFIGQVDAIGWLCYIARASKIPPSFRRITPKKGTLVMLTPMLFLLAPETAAATQQLNPLQKLLGGLGIGPMMLIIFGIFYLLVMRPQQQKQKDHESWQRQVGVGTEVATSGGLVGKITHATPDVVTVEVGDKVRVRVLRSHITGPAPGTQSNATASKDTSKDAGNKDKAPA